MSYTGQAHCRDRANSNASRLGLLYTGINSTFRAAPTMGKSDKWNAVPSFKDIFTGQTLQMDGMFFRKP